MVKKVGRSQWPRWIVQIVLGLVVAILAVGGVMAVGKIARDTLVPHDRYLVAFHDIECNVPQGQQRADFLGEVQYNGLFKDQINILDETLPDRLRDAFARHSKVQQVVHVTITPPKRIRVELVFRTGS